MHPVARLRQRTLGFARRARRDTRDPVWEIVAAPGQPSPDLLRRAAVEPADWARAEPALRAPTLAHALRLLPAGPAPTPPWLARALAAHTVASSADAAAALHDLALPRADPGLLVLAALALAHFSLAALLPALASHRLALPPHPHPALYANALLQALALFDRSRLAADTAIDILRDMDAKRVPLWPNTERVLLRDNFRAPRLLDYLRRRGPERLPEAWLRAHASLGRVQPSADSLHAIRTRCLDTGVPPPYSTTDAHGTAHPANTHYLRAMRDDRHAAFGYFHQLLALDLKATLSAASPKSSIDIYDWTTALYAAAHDRTLPASNLLGLFSETRRGTHAYRPTRATYTVVIQGLLWKNALDDAQKLWDEFVREVVSARGEGEMRIDRKALCVGVDVLVQSGRTKEALCLLEEAVQRDVEQGNSYLKVHPIHALFTALLRIRRPDAVFYIWTHLASLYFVPPTNLMLRILLKAAIQASKMDGESVKGAMSWYVADFHKRGGLVSFGTDSLPPSRDTLTAHLQALLETPAPPSVVGIWANRRSTEVARSIFRGMIFGNWPALRPAAGPVGGGVTNARAKGGDSVLQELARVWNGRPDQFLPPPTSLGALRPTQADERLGPPLPTVVPSESTFATYVALLGLSSRAEEIPEVLGWMRALGVVPKRETLAVAIVFWMEIGLRGPVFEDGWGGAGMTGERPRTEYAALRAWIRAWVGETRAPGEEDVWAGIKRVREMREGRFR